MRAESVDGSHNAIATNTLGSVTGTDNSAYGDGALGLLTTGSRNSAFGRAALGSARTSEDSSAFGFGALRLNLGSRNNAHGSNALGSNTSGSANNAFGYGALGQNTGGLRNNALGNGALGGNTTGDDNIALGDLALETNRLGNANVAVGSLALSRNTAGSFNVALGHQALYLHASGNGNSAVGHGAMIANGSGRSNTALGTYALADNLEGSFNVAVGSNALVTIEGNNNTALGYRALFGVAGNNNLALGIDAGKKIIRGSNNIMIANQGGEFDTRTIRLGAQGNHRATFIAGIRGATISSGLAVVVSNTGQLGVQTSSRRFKEDIHAMAADSDRIMQLEPVTFRYRQAEADGSKPIQYGLIAEDVAKVFPELVGYDRDGKPEAVAYQTLSSLLLNEVQKQHRALQRERAAVAQLQSRAIERDQELLALRDEVKQLKALTGELVAQHKAARQLAADTP